MTGSSSRFFYALFAILVVGALLAACGRAAPTASVPTQALITKPSPSPFQPSAPSPTAITPPTAEPSPTPAPLSISFDSSVPAGVAQRLADTLNPAGVVTADDPASPLRVALDKTPDDTRQALGSVSWVYALAAPFPTLADGVTLAQLQQAWQGQPQPPFPARPLLMDGETFAAFQAAWGPAGPNAVQVLPAEQLLDVAWQPDPSWAVVPFGALEPRWKVIGVDGQSPLSNQFDPAAYPLALRFELRASAGAAAALQAAGQDLAALLPVGNRDPSKLTVLAMTGVTALVRATAYRMEIKGILYPGEAVRDVLRAADLTHISNEISFTPECPYPDPMQGRLFFCSDPRYIELLDDMSTDIVELTGNHMMDWGPDAMPYTLDMYQQRGWVHYGGGADLTDSIQPALIEHNGNRLAFIGCNPAGPGFAWATDDHPGAAPCGDYEWIVSEVQRLKSEGYIPVVTFQYFESYGKNTTLDQQQDFKRMADAGAVIVNGSQAHVPKGMEFYNGAFIHYGLGNLFFDQMEVTNGGDTIIEGTMQEFIDRHVFYDGRHIGMDLLTYRLEDYARPRPMTEGERQSFLAEMFDFSFWNR